MADEKVEGRILQYATLLHRGACSDYRDLFINSWGTGEVLVTMALAIEQAQRWDWEWAARYLLTEDEKGQWRDKVRPAQDAYNTATSAVFAATDEGRDRAEREADEVRRGYTDPNSDAAWEAHGKVREDIVAPLYEAENKVVREAGAALKLAQATAWAEIYIKEGSTNE